MIAVADSMKKSVPSGYPRHLPRIIRKNTIPRSDTPINDLVKELIDLDLDIDGTKETLISPWRVSKGKGLLIRRVIAKLLSSTKESTLNFD